MDQVADASVGYVISVICNLRPLACNIAANQPIQVDGFFQETLGAF
jgi:hypothetical protein